MRLASSVTICGHLLSHITALHLAVSLHRHEIIELLAPYEAMLQDTLMHFTPCTSQLLQGTYMQYDSYYLTQRVYQIRMDGQPLYGVLTLITNAAFVSFFHWRAPRRL